MSERGVIPTLTEIEIYAREALDDGEWGEVILPARTALFLVECARARLEGILADELRRGDL